MRIPDNIVHFMHIAASVINLSVLQIEMGVLDVNYKPTLIILS